MMKNKKFRFHEAGTCPLCGSTLLVYERAFRNGTMVIPYQCPDCGAIGSENYEVSFLGHIDVQDGKGNIIEEILEEPSDLDEPESSFPCKFAGRGNIGVCYNENSEHYEQDCVHCELEVSDDQESN